MQTHTELRAQLIKDILDISEDKLEEIYNYLHSKSKVKKKNNKKEKILTYAGCWKELSDGFFDKFLDDVHKRRETSFSNRISR